MDNEDQSTMKANIVENYKALYREDADTTGLRLSKELAEALADFVSNYTGETLDMCSDDTVADLKEMSNKVARIEQELQDEKAKTDELNKTISENATKIQFLEAEDANMQSKNETLQSRIDSQATQIAALEESKSAAEAAVAAANAARAEADAEKQVEIAAANVEAAKAEQIVANARLPVCQKNLK